MKERGPDLKCKRLDADIDLDKFEVSVFDKADRVSMGQFWRDVPDHDFRPATVCAAWTDAFLLVYAELEDNDIFNPVTVFNAPAFQHGDVFEIFIRPLSQEAYYEFHVSPRNQQLQLRMPSWNAFSNAPKTGGIPRDWFVDDWRVESRVWLAPENGRWQVLVSLPLMKVAEKAPVKAGDEWLYSFSRYDYTQGRPQPVYSSTSPHKVLNFHRQEEWGRLVFCGTGER